MGISVVLPEIEIHTTPLEELFIDSTSITIFFDDINENRYKIIHEIVRWRAERRLLGVIKVRITGLRYGSLMLTTLS